MQADSSVIPIVDGWEANGLLPVEVGGHDRAKVEQRHATAAALLSANSTSIEPHLLSQVLEDVPARPVYIVARDSLVSRRLQCDQHMRLAYEGDDVSVFLIAKTHPVVGQK